MTNPARPGDLPSVDRLLNAPECAPLLAGFRREYVAAQCRAVLDELRTVIRQGGGVEAGELALTTVLARVKARMDADSRPGLIQVVNATGTVLHTNLGRAALPEPAIEAVVRAARHPVNLEYDLARGGRGRREQVIEALLVALTGAEAATVVNNNAAAVLLALNTLAEGKEVVVSRGELIEIGGSFRLPEIMAKSGALLREVGATNRTHLRDYEEAIGENTALLLKVHTSNYRIVGFTSEVDLPELAALGRIHGIPVVEDLGSGALVDLARYGLPKEPLVSESIARGADLVTFSGDKLLGGSQSGLIVGRARLVDGIARNPLHRAMRCDKLTVAAMEATLRLYQQSPNLTEDMPLLKTLTRSVAELEAVGRRLTPALLAALGEGFEVSLEDAASQIGSGALPVEEIPTKALAVRHARMSAEQVAARFRSARPPVLGRIHEDRFLLDLRTVADPGDLIPRWTDPGADSA